MIDPILYLPCFDFHPHRQRPQQLLYQLSLLGFDVIYCNVTKNKEQPFVRLNERFVICQDIEALPRQRYTMWLSHGPYLDELHRFEYSLLICDIADASVGRFAEFAPWHNRKIKEADLVLCASGPLYEEAKSMCGNALLVRNGAETERFTAAADKNGLPLYKEQEAAFLAGSTAPVVGFWGAVADWLDMELIGYLAENGRNICLFLLERSPAAFRSSSTSLPNLRWLGDQEYEMLPAFARQFDAAIIPFLINDLTNHANPIKMYESTWRLAFLLFPPIWRRSGRSQTLSASFPRATKPLLLKDWIPRCFRTARSTHIADRQQTAASESWEQRAQDVANAVNKWSLVEH